MRGGYSTVYVLSKILMVEKEIVFASLSRNLDHEQNKMININYQYVHRSNHKHLRSLHQFQP